MCGSGLIGAKVGIVGLGSIGLAVAKRLLAFDVAKILYCGRNVKPEGFPSFLDILIELIADRIISCSLAAQVSGEFVPFEQLLRESDVVIITCPLNDSTRNLFGAAQFAMMKSTAVLINTSRGGKKIDHKLRPVNKL